MELWGAFSFSSPQTEELEWEYHTKGRVQCLEIYQNTLFAAAYEFLHIFDLLTRRHVMSLPTPYNEDIHSVCVTEDLVVVGSSKNIYVWDLIALLVHFDKSNL